MAFAVALNPLRQVRAVDLRMAPFGEQIKDGGPGLAGLDQPINLVPKLLWELGNLSGPANRLN